MKVRLDGNTDKMEVNGQEAEGIWYIKGIQISMRSSYNYTIC